MKVLLTAFLCCPGRESEIGTGWNWAAGVARVHEVHLITSSLWRQPVLEAIERSPGLRLVPYFLPEPLGRLPGVLGWAAFYAWQLRAAAFAWRLHRRDRFDLCHSLTIASWRVPTFLWVLPRPVVWGPLGGGQDTPSGFRPVLGLRGAWNDAGRSVSQKLASLDPFVRIAMRKAAAILCVNRATRDRVPEPLRGNTRLMWDIGLDRSLDSGSDANSESTGSFGTSPAGPGEELRVVWVGRVLPWKGLLLLLRAMSRLSDATPCKLTVVGDGPDRGRCEAFTRRSGLSGRVTFAGWLDPRQVRRYYRASDVFVCTSLHDSSGNALMDAMAARLPVVVLDCGGPGELVPNDAGLKIHAGNPEQAIGDIAAALQRLWERPSERFAMGARGQERVRSSFRWDVRVQELLAVYDQVTHAAPKLARALRTGDT